MKKILLIAAVAAVASLAQSATVKWLVNGNANTIGQTVYLVLNSDIPSEVKELSDLTGKAFASGTIAKNGRQTNAAGEATSDKFTAGQTYTYTIFFVDSSTTPNKYLNGGTGSVTAYGPTDTMVDATASTPTYVADHSTWTSVTGGGQDPIPEPTTVALLALGLAAVGLKRKVA
ncbi:MAG: PEP-CTERM sorting domain-containing protein [Kiritimatiellae bacterium]|nr:PEP-CTERM sorting domain-containing protein [Kiritimatiellia bacterium]